MKINNEAINAINEGLEVPSFVENKEIRIKYVATDGWRGYYDAVPTKKGGWTKIESNWMTGNWDDAGENGADVMMKNIEKTAKKLEKEGKEVLVVYTPTSNVFSISLDVFTRDKNIAKKYN